MKPAGARRVAERVCGCGAVLQEAGGALVCPSCGAHASAWLVVDAAGVVLAAANRERIALGPALAGLAATWLR
jgi:uncharacterized Zn finger protein (UPF0148 family)